MDVTLGEIEIVIVPSENVGNKVVVQQHFHLFL
jgi:hypothetical protein